MTNDKLKMTNEGKYLINIAKRFLNLTLVICHLTLLVSLASAAEKFPAVSGEIYGQAAPGIVAIFVNNQPVDFDEDGNFSATIHLKAGQKYLSLRLDYETLRVIKKYLILRKAKDKTFKVFVAKETPEKPIKPKSLKKKKIKSAKKPVKAKITKKPAAPQKVWEYLYVWEFSEGKLLLVKEKKGKYAAEVVVPVSKQWLDLKGLTKEELKEIINK
jgi:hypothetical protein